jgi:hypothetical protein
MPLALPSCQSQAQRQPPEQKPEQKPATNEQKLPTKSKSPLTWAQFVQQGGNREIQVDYDLPIAFRNGPVYLNTEKDRLDAFILKQGLTRYPPVQDGLIQLNYEYMPSLISRGEMIGLRWELGDAGKKHAHDSSIRHPYKEVTCRRNVCLMASMMTAAERERILRSQHPIKPNAS